MKGALDIHRALLARGILHDIVRLPRLILRAEQLPDALGLPPAACLRVVVYQADDAVVTVTSRADLHPDPAAVVTLVGARQLAFADADAVSAATDYAAGLVAPLLLPPAVIALWDARIPDDRVVYCPTGECGTALAISARGLREVAEPTVARLCPEPAGAGPAAREVAGAGADPAGLRGGGEPAAVGAAGR